MEKLGHFFLTLKTMGFMKHDFSLNPLEGNYVFDMVEQVILICHQYLTFFGKI